ncbi:MAG: alanine dehydrogenase, partial [Candidatus Ratteibacteria bacterium]
MIIGLLKEIKTEEYRVGLAPLNVKELVKHGHKILVEKNAGIGSTFADTFYKECGAEIVSRDCVFESAELIVKVKEPQSSEIAMMRPSQI